MTPRRIIILSVAAFALVMWGAWLIWKWGVMRTYVAHDEVLVVINKYGKPLPSDLVVIPPDKYAEYKGIREEVLGPGRYFINPVFYDTKTFKMTTIKAGEPDKWIFSADAKLANPESAPRIGLLTRRQGKITPDHAEVVEAGYKGIQRDVLTPGTYKLNQYLYEVKEFPAVVIPPGSVGVVTRLFGSGGDVASATLSEMAASTTAPSTNPTEPRSPQQKQVPTRLVMGENQRGVLGDVLQPGVYYLNPRLYKVDILPIGYDALTLEHPSRPGGANTSVRFLSSDGYQVEADFTVVWGIAPADAPTIIANIGTWEVIERNVVRQAMIAACQNEGSKYTAKELIQGGSRSKFQDDLAASLEKQVASRNIHVLLALIRNIAIKDAAGQDQTEGLLATIQRANIEIERQITNKQKTETEKKRAELEQASKLVDVARETVAADTKVKVANILADGQKLAAEIDARRDLDVASIQQEISLLEAQTTQILGKAGADVVRMRNDAEAKGAKLLIDAFGSPAAYNSYTFAKNFQPSELRLIFAGPGTFWTDLKSFQDIGATKMIEQSQQQDRRQDLPGPR